MVQSHRLRGLASDHLQYDRAATAWRLNCLNPATFFAANLAAFASIHPDADERGDNVEVQWANRQRHVIPRWALFRTQEKAADEYVVSQDTRNRNGLPSHSDPNRLVFSSCSPYLAFQR